MKKQLSGILIVNIITALLSMITSFVLPKMLSVLTYGEIKSYQFYLSYIGLLHLGFADAIYLKYGGENIHTIDKKNANNEILHFILLQIGVIAPIIVCMVIAQKMELILVAFTIIPYNLLSYSRLIYQATGEFWRYMKVLLFNSILLFVFNMLFSLQWQIDAGSAYVMGYVIIYWICGLSAFFGLRRTCFVHFFQFDFKIITENVKNGISLMLGNFSGVLFSGLDRWFIKIFLTLVDFAYYSFANSIMNIMEVLLSPINITMYNYLIKHNTIQTQKYVKNIYTIFTFGFMSCMFIVKYIVVRFIPKYEPSISIIFFLTIAYSFMVIIKGLYVNLYKVNKQQKKYLMTIFFSLMLAFFSNLFAVLLFGTVKSIAICTIISVIFWEKICLKDYYYLQNNTGQNMYRIVLVSIYLYSGLFLKPILGMAIYLLLYLILTYLCYKNDSIYFLNSIIKRR